MSKVTKAKFGKTLDHIDFLKSECDWFDYEIDVRHRRNLFPQYDDLLEELEEAQYRLDKLRHRYQVEKRREREERQNRILSSMLNEIRRCRESMTTRREILQERGSVINPISQTCDLSLMVESMAEEDEAEGAVVAKDEPGLMVESMAEGEKAVVNTDEPSIVVEEDHNLESASQADTDIIKIEADHEIVHNIMFNSLENFDFIVPNYWWQVQVNMKVLIISELFPKNIFASHEYMLQRSGRRSKCWCLILLHFRIRGRIFSKKRRITWEGLSDKIRYNLCFGIYVQVEAFAFRVETKNAETKVKVRLVPKKVETIVKVRLETKNAEVVNLSADMNISRTNDIFDLYEFCGGVSFYSEYNSRSSSSQVRRTDVGQKLRRTLVRRNERRPSGSSVFGVRSPMILTSSGFGYIFRLGRLDFLGYVVMASGSGVSKSLGSSVSVFWLRARMSLRVWKASLASRNGEASGIDVFALEASGTWWIDIFSYYYCI